MDMKYKLTTARLIALSYGPRAQPGASGLPHQACLVLPKAQEIQEVLDKCVAEWNDVVGSSEVAMKRVHPYIVRELNDTMNTTGYDLLYFETTYRPVRDPDTGNVIGHDTVSFISENGQVMEYTNAGVGPPSGFFGCVFLSVGLKGR